MLLQYVALPAFVLANNALAVALPHPQPAAQSSPNSLGFPSTLARDTEVKDYSHFFGEGKPWPKIAEIFPHLNLTEPDSSSSLVKRATPRVSGCWSPLYSGPNLQRYFNAVLHLIDQHIKNPLGTTEVYVGHDYVFADDLAEFHVREQDDCMYRVILDSRSLAAHVQAVWDTCSYQASGWGLVQRSTAPNSNADVYSNMAFMLYSAQERDTGAVPGFQHVCKGSP